MTNDNRHKDDLSLWSIVESDTASQEDKDTAKELIASSEALRAKYEHLDSSAKYDSDDRHPDDEKFWAIIDDTNANDIERLAALSKLRQRTHERRKLERHPEDAALWAVMDDPEISEESRQNCLRVIRERMRRRNPTK